MGQEEEPSPCRSMRATPEEPQGRRAGLALRLLMDGTRSLVRYSLLWRAETDCGYRALAQSCLNLAESVWSWEYA